MDMKKVGSRIQKARQRCGMTQSELSQRLGMTPKYISNLECGAKTPRLETFVALSNILQTDANSLLVDVLDVSSQLRCGALWDKLSLLPPEKREKALRMLDMLTEEL